MKYLTLLLLAALPDPVMSIGATINPDNSVTITWTLPADPSVVGVTIIRDRLDLFEGNVSFTLNGAPVSFTDTTALVQASYRYWVYTRNAGGELSVGMFVEVIGTNGNSAFVGTSSSWFCFAGIGPGDTPPLPFLASAVLVLLALRRR
jgi:hypothetical protein